jgi:hypothetical protein
MELYDISKDPYEKNNLLKKQATVATSLAAELKQWQSTLPERPSGNVFSELRNKL